MDIQEPAVDRAPPAAARRGGARIDAVERAAIVLAVLVGLMLAGRTAVALARIPLNYNEGWMAYFAGRALGGAEPLYPTPGGLVTNNYPPLSFYLFGWAGRLVGDTVIAGRLAALAALLATAGLVFAAARRLGASRAGAATGALAFLGLNLTVFHTYVAIADPQWLAQAVMAAGLLPLIRPPSEGPLPVRAVVAACLVMALGGLVKHNLLALPAAASLWLFRHDRRAFLVWVGTGIAAVVVAGLAMGRAYGTAAFFDILEHARRMDWAAWPDALVYLLPLTPLAAAAVALWRSRAGDRRVELVLLFAALGLAFAVLQRLGEGVNVNAYFEALVALSIGAGAALSSPARPRWTGWAVVAPALILSPWFLVETARAVADAPRDAGTWRRLTTEVAAAPGPVACEMLSVCYWAGKPFALDVFNTGERLRAGAPAGPLTGAIRGRAYGAILVIRDKAYFAGEGRLPPPIPGLIEESYAPADEGPGGTALMRPKPTAPSPPPR